MRSRIDRLFSKYLRTGNPWLLAKVLDHAAPELWRIAAHLCRTQHDAEDVVQSTFLTAMEERQAWDPLRPVMPWLVGILVNRARERRRQVMRTVDVARLTLPAIAGPVDAASDREFQHTLNHVLSQIHEPFRTVVARHLVQGMTARDIATDLSIPTATVRTRLHRGIQQLRQRLPGGVVGMAVVPTQIPAQSLATVRQVVMDRAKLQAAAASHAGVAAITVVGGLLMKQLLVVAAVLLVGAASWLMLDVQPARGVGTQPPAPQLAQQHSATIDGSFHGNASQDRRLTAAPARDRVAVAAVGELVVMVVNAKTQKPLEGIEVTAQNALQLALERRGSGTTEAVAASIDPQANHPQDNAPSVAGGTTDANGRVSLRIATGRVVIGARRGLPPKIEADVRADQITESLLEIPAPLDASVLVLDGNGKAIPDATIYGHDDSTMDLKVLGRTTAAGLWHEPRTELRLFVRAAANSLALSAGAWLLPYSPNTVITLETPSASVHGIVMNETGSALPDAILVFAAKSGNSFRVRSDAQGRYRCDWLEPGGYDVLVSHNNDKENRRVMTFSVTAVAGEGPPCNLQMTEGASFITQLRRPNGDPLANHHVLLARDPKQLPATFSPYFMLGARTNNDGLCELRHVMPGSYQLTANFEHATIEATIDLQAGDRKRFDHTFEALCTLQIEIVGELAEPRPDIRVTLKTSYTEKALKTDSAGRVQFEGLGQQSYEVALFEADARFAHSRHQVTPSGIVRLVMPRSNGLGKIVGRFEVTGSELPTGLKAALQKDDEFLSTSIAELDIDQATGAFAIDRLPPGHYALWAHTDSPPLAVRSIEVASNRASDLGTIPLGTGKLDVEIVRENANDSVVVGIATAGSRLFSDRPGTNLALAAGTYQVLVWGENTRPSFAEAVVNIGATSTVRVEVLAGVRTEVELAGEWGVLDVQMPDGTTIRVLASASPWVRGFAPGRYAMQFRGLSGGLNGERSEAEFEVGTSSGAPIKLRKTSSK